MNIMRKNRLTETQTGGVKFVQKQKGATLIEVLISMLMLGLGVLVLLATQLRTVSGVREAENQTIVAQATQNLIEGMLMNPQLEPPEKVGGDQQEGAENVIWNRKRYDYYVNALKNLPNIVANCGLTTVEKKITKEDLASSQVCDFALSLSNNLPDVTLLRAHICWENEDREPTIAQGNVDWKCRNSRQPGDYTVVKVLWLMNTENKAASGGVKIDGDSAVYTYQARVTE